MIGQKLVMGPFLWLEVRIHNPEKGKGQRHDGQPNRFCVYTVLRSWDPSEEVLCEACPEPMCWEWAPISCLCLSIYLNHCIIFVYWHMFTLQSCWSWWWFWIIFRKLIHLPLDAPPRFRIMLVTGNEEHGQVKWKESHFSFLKLYFIDYTITVVPTFSLFPPPPSTSHSLRWPPHPRSCPWVTCRFFGYSISYTVPYIPMATV